jgi:hypothetical protein
METSMQAARQLSESAVSLELERLRVLKARYFRLVDTKQWDAWGALFEPDATTEYEPGRILRGRDEIVRFVAKTFATAVTVHQGFMPELELLSPTEARGVWAMSDRVRGLDGSDFGGATAVDGWGHYHETYVRSQQGWRIKTLRLTRLDMVIRTTPEA